MAKKVGLYDSEKEKITRSGQNELQQNGGCHWEYAQIHRPFFDHPSESEMSESCMCFLIILQTFRYCHNRGLRLQFGKR